MNLGLYLNKMFPGKLLITGRRKILLWFPGGCPRMKKFTAENPFWSYFP